MASTRRIALARILAVLGALFAVVAMLSGYIRFQGLDTDTVEETASDLIADDEIRDQIATSLVEQLFGNVDVTAILAQRLPPDQQGLAAPLAGALRELADRSAHRLLERPRPQALWVESISRTHQQLLRLLDDDVTGVSTEDGAVVLDLRPLVIQLGDRVAVIGRVAQTLPDDTGRIEIMEADKLERAQDLTQLFKRIAAVIWIVPLLLWGVALWLARGRRRTTLRLIAIFAIVVGLLVLAVRRVAGGYIVDALTVSTAVEPAAQDAWDILTSLLADGAWTMIGLGVIALIGVWLAGPSRSGTAARRELAPFLARPELAFGGAAILLLALVVWGPTVQTTRPQLVVAAALVLAVGVEALRRIVAREHPEAADVEVGEAARAAVGRLRSRPSTAGQDQRLADLERLSRLREQGILTDEEFEAQKARLLGT